MRIETRDRIVAGAGAAVVTGLLGALLVFGLNVTPDAVRETALAVLDVPLPKPPPPPRPPEPVHGYKAARAAGAPAPRAKATPMVVPPPIVPLPAPPVVAAPTPSIGAASATGASTRGSGMGAGGEGNGPGGGGEGGSGDDTPPEQIAGRLKFSDLPPDRRDTGQHWLVWVRYQVGVDGRVSDCRAARSSGDPEVDAATCAAIEHRFRFRPALDGEGRPFAAGVEEYHEWTIERERGDDDYPPPR